MAVLGRFKAGKCSFLNHFLDTNHLPVGVMPVTAVITEIKYGAEQKVTVHFLFGRNEEVTIGSIRGFIAESENPENTKQVAHLTIELSTLKRFKKFRFIDTHGLERALAHNTEKNLSWIPSVSQ